MNQFEKGQKYERLQSSLWERRLFGWICIVLSPVMLFSQEIWWTSIFLIVFGISDLFIARGYKKELEELR